MPAPAFGFSAGQFVSAIDLLRKISKALKRTGGASTKYQHAIIELKGLENVLRHLESLEPNQDNERHINAVRGMALACQLPLRDFLAKLEKYEASLGPFSSPQWFRGLPQKSKWAVTFAEEVEKMRALVAAKTVSISLLLALDLSKSFSKMEANLGKRREKEHSELLSKAAEHRSALDSMEGRITNIEDGIQHAAQTSDKKLEALSSDMKATKAAVMSFRGIGQQIMSFVSAFPLEMRDLLQKILQSNWQIYHILLSIQQSLTQSPTQSLDSNIQFEDAMGELIPLPYVYFRHWETFEGFLRSHFKGTIGEVKVSEGQYNILSVDNGWATVKKDLWTRSIDQGARISMSMIMSRLRRAMGQCPRPSCTGSRFVQHHVRTNLLTCELCNLKFYAEAGELEEIFSQVTVQDEEERVAQKQVEEDLRIYGTRHEPLDHLDLDEDKQLNKLPPKRSASEFEAAVDRPAKARKKSESQTYNYENVTAMDWNAGESPMMAWVNQSAVPAAIPRDTSQTDLPVSKDEELLQQEKKEIEIFKNVHVSDALAPSNNANFAATLECGSDLDFRAQIYYRNIVDRYPLLPPYLARRLAITNYYRAERLQQSRLRNEPMRDTTTKTIDAPQLQPRPISLITENFSDNAPSIPINMPEEKAATVSHRHKTLTNKERRLLCEHYLKFPNTKFTELGDIFGVERSMVTKILRFKHKYLEQKVGREPTPVDRSQSNVFKPLEQLDESAPWSSWSEITAAGSYAMEALGSPASSNRSTQESQSNAVNMNDHSMQMLPAWTIDSSRMSIPYLDRHISDAYQDELYNPDFQLAQAPQYIFSQDRPISPTTAAPFVPAPGPSPPPKFNTHFEQHPIFLQARPQGDSTRNGISIDGERYACEACFNDYRVSSCQHTDRPLMHIEIDRRGSHTAPSPSNRRKASSPKPEQDFWTGRRQSHRPSSVQSYGSSRNSSLHGSPVMDPSYQSPVFSTEDQKHGSTGAGSSPRGLFPAPIDWTASQSHDQVNKRFSFDCEICGEVVKANRRRDWQNHVMNDLRPYVCTVEDCSQADETYSTVKDSLKHENLFHEVPYTITSIGDFAKRVGKSFPCLFCGQQTTDGRGQRSRGRHVGQHMEEIAFMVVPKAYEDWEFYSEASSGKYTNKRKRPYDCKELGCENSRGFTCSSDLHRHRRVVHHQHRGPQAAWYCPHKDCKRSAGFGFSYKDNLAEHLRQVHEDTTLSENSTDISIIQEALRTEPGKSHVCTTCDKRFARREHLERHHQTHSFVCPVCSRHFARQDRLSSHQSRCHVHRCDKINPSTGKPCKTVFSRAYDLTRHDDNIHSSRKKKVRCELCTEEKTFSRRDALTRHMRVVHPDVGLPWKKRRGVRPVPEKAAQLEDGTLDQTMEDVGG